MIVALGGSETSAAIFWAAVSAIASAVAAGMMWATFSNQRRHNRLSVEPRLQFCWHAGDADPLGSGLILENNGLGAAIIERFEVHIAGQRLFGLPRTVWSEATSRVESLAKERGVAIPQFRGQQYALDVGSSLGAADRRMIWGVRPGGLPEMPATQRRELFGFFADTIEVHLDYRSIYGDVTWRLDSTDNVPRASTRIGSR